MQISEAYALVQHFLMYACLAALACLAIVAAFWKFAPVWDEIWHKWLGMDGFGKAICAGAVVMATLYGGSKGFWKRVEHDGIDSGYSLAGIFTATSNDVQVISGQTVTNEIPMVAVMTLNQPVPQSIDVSVRMSETNEWTTIGQKINPYFDTEGTTNILAFATAQDYSNYLYWWAGSNRPAVIITSTDIEITLFQATSTGVRIDWTCEQPLATTFQVQWKEGTNSVWNTAATVNSHTATISGFWIGRTIDWRIISEYLEDGE